MKSLDGKHSRKLFLVRYFAFALYCIASRNWMLPQKGFQYAYKRLTPRELEIMDELCMRLRFSP